MTSSEQYMKEQAEAEHLIRRHAPSRLQDQLTELLHPLIVLTVESVDDAQIPVGASKFGGVPDVPANFEWPMWEEKTPLNFLAQINLEDATNFDVKNVLPSTGTLAFFYGVKDAPSEAIHRVYWFLGAELSRFQSPPTMPEFKACRVDFSLRLEMASDFECLEWEDFQEMLQSSMPSINSPAPRYVRMLGLPDTAFTSCYSALAECWVTGASPPKEYRVLLQVGSLYIPGMCWSDAGILSFVMHKDDLAARQFDKVHLDMDVG